MLTSVSGTVLRFKIFASIFASNKNLCMKHKFLTYCFNPTEKRHTYKTNKAPWDLKDRKEIARRLGVIKHSEDFKPRT